MILKILLILILKLKSSMYLLLEDVLILTVRSIQGTQCYCILWRGKNYHEYISIYIHKPIIIIYNIYKNHGTNP